MTTKRLFHLTQFPLFPIIPVEILLKIIERKWDIISKQIGLKNKKKSQIERETNGQLPYLDTL